MTAQDAGNNGNGRENQDLGTGGCHIDRCNSSSGQVTTIDSKQDTRRLCGYTLQLACKQASSTGFHTNSEMLTGELHVR